MNATLLPPDTTRQNFFTLELLNVTGGGLTTRHYGADHVNAIQNPKGYICEFDGTNDIEYRKHFIAVSI